MTIFWYIVFYFQVAHSLLLFDVMKKLLESFKERDIELILLLLRSEPFLNFKASGYYVFSRRFFPETSTVYCIVDNILCILKVINFLRT